MNPVKRGWWIQYEFDHEATYVVHSTDQDQDTRSCVTLGPGLPVALRRQLAAVIQRWLNDHAADYEVTPTLEQGAG